MKATVMFWGALLVCMAMFFVGREGAKQAMVDGMLHNRRKFEEEQRERDVLRRRPRRLRVMEALVEQELSLVEGWTMVRFADAHPAVVVLCDCRAVLHGVLTLRDHLLSLGARGIEGLVRLHEHEESPRQHRDHTDRTNEPERTTCEDATELGENESHHSGSPVSSRNTASRLISSGRSSVR